MTSEQNKRLQQFLKLYAERMVTLTEFVNEVTKEGYDVVSLTEAPEEDGKGMCYARLLPKGLSAPIQRIATMFNR